MAPGIAVFYNGTDRSHIINKINPYWTVMVDEMLNTDYVRQKYNKNCRLFIVDPIVKSVALEELDSIVPDLVVYFDVDLKVTEDMWADIKLFFQTIFSGNTNDHLYNRISEFFFSPTKLTHDVKQVEQEELPDYYSYHEKYDSERDRLYCEIRKPFTDKPYTTFVENYSTRGIIPMFTSFYAAASWGVARADHAFLLNLWNQKQIKEDFDIESRVAQHVNDCKMKIVPEPKVYRDFIENVIKL